ncbi:betaine--homocysteine S-methyltransferase [Sulfitobacter aestuariivivens]|uniref:Betaine--homocysteine S-methyltransferase n=1 Tax=Sulfitobacter aestuariivivens TaxID=2766981 RepID=A0A927D5U9_9RHOB|nr:betaine--homocysteine S-methyltransferase [Sulfitobacter aestuariivivens]MBD3663361.1 betaine--homocysteine S-methyltransferase [Sulfitobacter aestuariivivens]
MTNPFIDLLAQKGTLLADGATGTNLFNMGLMSGDAPELWNTDEPAKITTLYKGAVDAGSDLFLTNSFGANASRLKLHGAEKRVHELARVSAELARNVADKAERKVIVAGSVGPTGEIMEPVGTLSHALAVEMFHEAADGLKAGGADIGWLETISAPEEYRAAAEGFALAGLPWCGTMSFDTAGRTMMGLTSEGMVDMVDGLENAPLAFGANCGTGASDLLRTVLGFAAKDPARPIIAKGNAGIPKYHDGHIHYDGTPELMGDYAVMARDCGASVIGGCCGTMPAHLAVMRDRLDSTEKGEAPSLDQIVAALGDFSSAGDGTGEDVAPKRERRGRRRS